MRKILLPVLFGSLILANGCDDSPDDQVNAVADASADFCSYHTFQYYDISEAEVSDPEIPLPPSAANAELLFKNATTAQLKAAGLDVDDDDPDLKVNFVWALNSASVISTACSAGWYGYWFGYACFDYEEEVPVGTVILDLVDTNTDQTVFRGVMMGIIDGGGNYEERIADAVTKIFLEYPTNITACP